MLNASLRAFKDIKNNALANIANRYHEIPQI
jgi:hypothetical protein